jgi:signal transduction histidine kinase/DNA-binding response OmpR family regulator
MKILKRVPVYFAVFAVSIFLCFFLSFSVETNYANLKVNLEKEANTKVYKKVNSMILKIDTYRKYSDEESVKKIVHDTLVHNSEDGNEYIWINEVINWDGGDNYAFRFVNPNFPETEEEMISTTLVDIPKRHPYLEELDGIKKDGEIYYQFYFKNYLNDDVEIKYSFAKLYKDFNWIIGCGIPESDLFADATFTYKKERQILYLFYIIVTILDVFVCFIIYSQKKKREVYNRAKMVELKANSKIEAKTEFFSTLSHELRAPLNAIIGLNDLLRENIKNEQTAINFSYKIDESSKLLLTLINDVLDMSAIEKGKLKLANEDFDLKSLIYSISDIYYNLSKKKGLSFKVILNDIDDEQLIGDQYRIRQIVFNLLSNGLKFTDKGSLILTVKEERIDDKTTNLILSVQDTGCGIKKDTISRLFEQFEQADASVVSKHGGSGLGLSISKQLVTAMKGTINVESEVAVGSQFSVTLPLAISCKKNEVRESLNNHSAIIVDNDEDTMNELLKIFDVWNVKNKGFKSSLKALEYIKENPTEFSLYLFDFKMPNLNGFELAQRIRAINKEDVNIIVSNYDLNELRVQNNHSVTSFIQKPIFKSELYDHIINRFTKDAFVNTNQKQLNYRGFKILSVEDNGINQLIIRNILEKVGIEIFVASNGLQAIDFMKTNEERNNIDIIFMDVRMPGMDGLTATKKIREFNKNIPIIALSANAFDIDVKKSLDAGMNAHLSKPLDKVRLFEILKEYLHP